MTDEVALSQQTVAEVPYVYEEPDIEMEGGGVHGCSVASERAVVYGGCMNILRVRLIVIQN